ncbi:MAG: S8 family serine peptidase [Burkholderiaceae bacterium]
MFRRSLQSAIAALLLLVVTTGSSQAPTHTERGLPVVDRSAESTLGRVIVKYKPDGDLMRSASAGRTRYGLPFHAAALSQRFGLRISDGRVLGPRTQSLHAPGVSSARLAAQLAADPNVEWAVPDQRRFVRALTNDPYLSGGQTLITPAVGQWYLRAPDATAVSAINAVTAWDTTSGSPLVTVAVIDTGVRSHTELAAKLHPGYDFIHDDAVARDGDGRDADANDPGDFERVTDCASGIISDSSWHGTQVAGLIGATTNDGIGMASVGRDVMILPVRVLGRCGGFDSDIIAGMRWAGGLTSEVGFGASVSVPNTHPAQVINMSLGSPGSCPASYRDAIAELNQIGVTVVVAAGNENGLAVNTPANCAGALAVGGLRHTGTKVGYSNVGPQVAIAAPAGNCVNISGPCLFPLLTTSNSGSTVAVADSYSDSSNATIGTSFAAPLVAGTVGLMLSVNPGMTPAQVRQALQSSASTFVTSGAAAGVTSCRAPDLFTQIECYCTRSTCGAGMLNAALAVVHALNPFVVIHASSTAPAAGSVVALDASGSSAQGGRSITGYQWSITAGADLARFNGATNGATASLQVLAPGTITVHLTITDNTAASGTGDLNLEATAGAGASSGGGAFDLRSLGGLVVMAVLVLLAGRRARR